MELNYSEGTFKKGEQYVLETVHIIAREIHSIHGMDLLHGHRRQQSWRLAKQTHEL